MNPEDTKVNSDPSQNATDPNSGVPATEVKTQDTTANNNNPLIPSGTTQSAITTAPATPAAAPAPDLTTAKAGDVVDLGAAGKYTKNADGSFSPVATPVEGTTPNPPSTTIMAKPTAPTVPQPTVPNESQQYTDLYNKYGISGLQTQLNQLNEQKSATADALASFKLNEQQNPGETESGYTARIGEAERNAMARSDFYDRQMQSINDRLTTANTFITETMKLTDTDYTNAEKSYNDTYANYLSAQTEYNKEATAEQNEAAAYLASVQDLITKTNASWDSFSPALKASIQSEETKAGWAPGTLQAFAAANPNANIITSYTDADGTSRDIVSRDPNTGVISVTQVTAGGTGGSATVQPTPPAGTTTAPTGYGGEILQGTNVDPQATIDDLLKPENADKLNTMFDKMVTQEGGDTAAGASVNNPLDLKYVAGNSYGATDSGIKAQDGGTFAAFPDKATAYKAYAAQLGMPIYKGLTVDQALKKWSNYSAGGVSTSTTSITGNKSSGMDANGQYQGPSIDKGYTADTINTYLQTGPSFVYKGSTYSQGAIYNAAINSILGITDTTAGGMGGQQGKSQIANKKAAIMAAYNLSPIQVASAQKQFAAMSSAQTKLVNQDVFVKTYTGTATDALKLALKNYPANGGQPIKIVNNFTNWLKTNTVGGGPLAALETNIYTAAREYAKVTSGGSASVAATTDTANAQVEKLLNAAQTPEQFQAAVTQMEADMKITNKNFDDQIQSFAPDVASLFGVNMESSGTGNNGGTTNSGSTVTAPDGTKIVITD